MKEGIIAILISVLAGLVLGSALSTGGPEIPSVSYEVAVKVAEDRTGGKVKLAHVIDGGYTLVLCERGEIVHVDVTATEHDIVVKQLNNRVEGVVCGDRAEFWREYDAAIFSINGDVEKKMRELNALLAGYGSMAQTKPD